MLKAILQQGVIVPLEPLPSEWNEGTALEVAKANDSEFDIEDWAASMNRLCADSRAEDEDAMRRAIDEHRLEAKRQVQRDMGLSA